MLYKLCTFSKLSYLGYFFFFATADVSLVNKDFQICGAVFGWTVWRLLNPVLCPAFAVLGLYYQIQSIFDETEQHNIVFLQPIRVHNAKKQGCVQNVADFTNCLPSMNDTLISDWGPNELEIWRISQYLYSILWNPSPKVAIRSFSGLMGMYNKLRETKNLVHINRKKIAILNAYCPLQRFFPHVVFKRSRKKFQSCWECTET